jgi:hypothetical protein
MTHCPEKIKLPPGLIEVEGVNQENPIRPLSPMNELPMNLTAERVDYGYLKVLIVSQAVSVKMLCQNPAMSDRVGIVLEFHSNAISQRNAVFHVKEIFLHNFQPWFVLVASQLLFRNKTRSDTAICRC